MVRSLPSAKALWCAWRPRGRRGLRNSGSVPLTHLVLQVRPGTISGGPISDGYRLPEPPRMGVVTCMLRGRDGIRHKKQAGMMPAW